jgi:hypothetical protein
LRNFQATGSSDWEGSDEEIKAEWNGYEEGIQTMAIDKERVEKALKDLSILSAQIGNAKLRKLYRKPLEEFIKEAAKALRILWTGKNELHRPAWAKNHTPRLRLNAMSASKYGTIRKTRPAIAKRRRSNGTIPRISIIWQEDVLPGLRGAMA